MFDVRSDQTLHLATCIASLVASYFSLSRGTDGDVAILLASLFLVIIVVTDTLFRKIHNIPVLILILCGFAMNIYLHATTGLLQAFLGLAIGLALLLPFYLLGGMGAGDVKALAALGALTGPAEVFQIFLYVALIGGVLSILHYCLNSNLWQKSLAGLDALRTFLYTRDIRSLAPNPERERQSLPYAAAIALGFFAFVQWGPIITLS